MHAVVTGATGYLGSYVVRAALERGWSVTALNRRHHPIFQHEERYVEYIFEDVVKEPFDAGRVSSLPVEIIVHIAAVSSGSLCEEDPVLADRGNVLFTRKMIELASQSNARLIYISTDLVFDGSEDCPSSGFSEGNSPLPRSVYSKTKFEAEECVRASSLEYTILRSSLLYGEPIGELRGTLAWMHDSFQAGRSVPLFSDEWRTFLWVCDAALTICEVAERRLSGLYHMGGPERLNRQQFGEFFAAAYGYKRKLIEAVRRQDMLLNPLRPRDVSLNSGELRKTLSRPYSSPEAVFRVIRDSMVDIV